MTYCPMIHTSAPGGRLPIELVDEIFKIFACTYAITSKPAVAAAALTSRTAYKFIQPILYHTVAITKTNCRAVARTYRDGPQPNPFAMTRHLVIQTNALYRPLLEHVGGIFDKFTGLNSIGGLPHEVDLWFMTEPAHKLSAAAILVAGEAEFLATGQPWHWTPVNLTHLALYSRPYLSRPQGLTLQDMYPRLTHIMLDLTRPHTSLRHVDSAREYLLLPSIQRVLLVICTAIDPARIHTPAIELFNHVPHLLFDPRLYYVDVPAPENPFDPVTAFDMTRWERGHPEIEFFDRAAA